MLPPAPDEQSLQSTGICQHGYSLDFRLKNQRTYDSLEVFEAIEFANVARTELPTPMPNGFVGDDDAWFSQKIFHKAKAQTETVIKPDGMADDLGREAMAAAAGGQKTSTDYLRAGMVPNKKGLGGLGGPTTWPSLKPLI